MEPPIRSYPLGSREAERCRAVRRIGLLDTPPGEEYDRICRMAQRVLKVPIVVVTIVDEHRLWYKAKLGLDARQTPRNMAFCNYTILADEVMIVEDATKDHRFQDNPVVTSQPRIRAYVAAPLALEPGLPLGTFCIMDKVPRTFTPRELEEVRDFASIVVDQLRLHEANQAISLELAKSEARRALVATQAEDIRRRQLVAAHTERMANVAGWQYEVDTGQIIWSDYMFEIYELPRDTAIDAKVVEAAFSGWDREILRESSIRSIEAGVPFEFECDFTTAKNNRRWVSISGYIDRGRTGPVRIIGILKDMTEQKASSARLWFLANNDELTGLSQRRVLEQRLKKPGLCGALLMIDIDHFKDINDTLGHEVGDQVLKEVARRLDALVPADSIVARYGGDEFCILLEGVRSRADVTATVDLLLARLRDPADIDGYVSSCRASIGITFVPETSSAEQALKDADLALYAAKAAGRDRFAFYKIEQREEAERHLVVLRTIQEALDDERVIPFYQPKVSLATGKVVGFEALMRWRDPTQGIQPPGLIADAFDDVKLSVAIGARMLAKVVSDISVWRRDDLPFGHVAINAAAPEFAEDGFAGRILEHLKLHEIPPSCLELEVTETVFLGRGAECVGASLRELAASGVAIALDDFGTGYASLTHLKAFPVDWLKIDRSFISAIETDPNAATIVETLISLGRSLGIRSVAEGVETEGQLQFLRDRSCDLVQGYLLGKPMNGSRVPYFLRNWQGFRRAPSPNILVA